jgi:hypothetical protein
MFGQHIRHCVAVDTGESVCKKVTSVKIVRMAYAECGPDGWTVTDKETNHLVPDEKGTLTIVLKGQS